MKFKAEIGRWTFDGGEPEYNGISFRGTWKQCDDFIKKALKEKLVTDMDNFPIDGINHILIKPLNDK